MDKETTRNLLLAVAISFLIIQLWSYFFAPKQSAPPPAVPSASAPVSAEPTPPGGVGPAGAGTVPATTTLAPAVQYPNVPQIAGDPQQPPVEVATPIWQVSLSARGGRVLSWKLSQHPRSPGKSDGELIDLVSPEARALDRHPLTLISGDEALDKRLNEAWCVVDRTAPTPAELADRKLPEGTTRIAFQFADGELELRKSLWLPPGEDYLARVEWSVTRAGQPQPQVALNWGPGVVRPEDHRTTGHLRGQIKLSAAGGLETLNPLKGSIDRTFGAGSGIRWIGLDEQYFAVAMFPATDAGARIRSFDTPQSGQGHERQAAIELLGGAATVFAGPKESKLLARLDSQLGSDLARIVPWGFFEVVARPLYRIVSYFRDLLGNWGLAIIIVTLLIKLVFYPLTQRSMVSMRKTQEKMSKLQPKLKKLKEKYEGQRDMESRQKMNQEMMALYQTEGINPLATLGGCLPLLLQMPVLYAMYTALTVPIELRGAPFFGWISDLSAPEPAPWLLLLGMVATQFVQQFLAMTKTEDPQLKAQQRMMLLMPLMFAFFFWSMPAGLVLYWFMNNLLGIAQQYLINRQAAVLAKAA
jgi:YidC/Oxa1 family membrane protein insertase